MKLLKTLMAGLLAMAFVATAHASTVKIYLVGSTAYRASVHTAIINSLNAGGTYTFAYSASSGASGLGADPGKSTAGSGASQAIYSGTIAGQAVIIKTNWSGSAGGIQVVTQNIPVNFMTDTSLTGATSSGIVVAGTVTDSEVPTVTMSDGFQSSTPFTSPILTPASGNGTAFVGVVPFVFVINADWPGANAGQGANAFNVTPQNARDLWSNGFMPLAIFTGSHADEGHYVYALGRDNDSGTRLTAFAETGIGVFSSVIQWQPTFGGSVTSLTVSGSGSGYSSATVNIYGSGGYGYTAAPTVTASGGGGSASLSAVMAPATSGSTVIGITVNSSSGYTGTPTISFSGGLGSPGAAANGASAFVDTTAGDTSQGQILQVILANPGSGASATPTFTSGSLSGFTSLVGGSNFQAAPTVAIAGNGASATATGKAGNYVVTSVAQWPAETINGLPLPTGEGGYASGGSLAVALGTTGGPTNLLGYMIAYLGTSDASTASGLDSNADGGFTGSGLGAKVCSYNGVAYSPTALDEGQYTFWGYEHMYYGSGLGSVTNGVNIVNAIATQIASSDAVIKVGASSGFNVVRTTDGGVVSNNY